MEYFFIRFYLTHYLREMFPLVPMDRSAFIWRNFAHLADGVWFGSQKWLRYLRKIEAYKK